MMRSLECAPASQEGTGARERFTVTRKLLRALLVVAALGAAFSLGRLRSPRAPSPERRILYWVDPMHPSYRSDKPGSAPDCGMALEPVYDDDASRAIAASQQAQAGAVQISSSVQQ